VLQRYEASGDTRIESYKALVECGEDTFVQELRRNLYKYAQKKREKDRGQQGGKSYKDDS
jgi:hypothetical protein